MVKISEEATLCKDTWHANTIYRRIVSKTSSGEFLLAFERAVDSIWNILASYTTYIITSVIQMTRVV